MGAFLVPSAMILPPCSTTRAAAGVVVVEALMVAPGAIVSVAPALTKAWQLMVCSPAGTLVSVAIGPHKSTQRTTCREAIIIKVVIATSIALVVVLTIIVVVVVAWWWLVGLFVGCALARSGGG